MQWRGWNAIPISKAQPILEDIMKRKTREIVDEEKAAYMGIKLRNRSQEVIQMYDMPTGAFISGVVPGAAADEAGIREGDIVETLDGLQVSSEKDLLDKLQRKEARRLKFVLQDLRMKDTQRQRWILRLIFVRSKR